MSSSNDHKQPSLLMGGVHLAVLWAFAFQQPMLDLLGRNADFFVVRGNTRGDIIAYAVLYTFLPPLIMLAAEWVALRVRRSIYEGLHLTLVGALGAAIALQLLKDNVFSGPSLLLILFAIGLGVVLARFYRDSAFPPQALTILSPAPVLFLVVFLLFSPVHKLILPQPEAKAERVQVTSNTPVVTFIVDEFPVASLMKKDGTIDASYFPNFAELAAHSTWYRDTTSVAGFTTRAVPAILTGKDPGNKLPISSDQPQSIFTLLGGTYKMNVVETATAICPPKLCGGKQIEAAGGATRETAPQQDRGRFRTRMRQLVEDLFIVSEHLLLPNGIRDHLPDVDQTFGNFGAGGGDNAGGGGSPSGSGGGKKGGGGNAEQVKVGASIRKDAFKNRPQKAAAFIASLKDTPQTLNLLHLAFPHFPWHYVPSLQQYFPKSPDVALNDGVWPNDANFVHYGQQRHLLQAIAADRMLGNMIKKMKQVGLWKSAIFVVTADHGGSFIANVRRRDPVEANMGEVAPVPLFVRDPGQAKGRIDDAHRCTTDVLPIIAKALNVKIPWPTYKCTDTVTIASYEGKPVSYPLSLVLRQRDEAVDRRIAVFGEGGGVDALYRYGPSPGLIGKAVGSVASASGGGGSVAFEQQDFNYEPSSDKIPAIVQGVLQGVKPGEPLAIAVNGTVATTTNAFTLLDETRVAALLPPKALKAGANAVQVLRIVGAGPGQQLQPLSQ